jgi:hypothetical protein
VRLLESMVAAAQSVGFQGAMYTAPALQGRQILWSSLAPLLTSRLLGANGWAVRWLVPPGV